jgi:NADPH2:quinone reductase
MVQGKHKLTPKLPFYPGGEISGVVGEIAAVGSDEKAECVLKYGADDVVNYATEDLRVRVNYALLKSCSIVGVNHQHFFVTNPQQAEEDIAELLQMYKDGQIDPVICEFYPMEQAPAALKKVSDREAIGKVVAALR